FNPYISPSKKKSKYEPEFRDSSITSTYEPGSVMKPVTIASALEVGALDPSWTFNDTGPLKIGAATINTWDGKHWGKQTLSQLLQKSNNIGAAMVAQETGAEALRSYFLNFGFGSQLGIDLEGEEAGLVKRLKDWRAVDLATAGFGQGIAITPLQMASAYATIANGGMVMKPYLVEKIADRSGREIKFSPQPIRRVVSKKTTDVVTELLRAAVEGGESVVLRGIKYRVAGKTGTAQIPVGGKYDPNKTNVTFVGFPFKDKSFVMVIRLEEPTSSTFSATTVVPLWIEAFEQIAPLMGILPDK
ncbi:MAG: penicillin-binding transpeptidase domain-containing protein, partial [bacterium]|nr:penicillin-binding transpeptidase domain-containing protein [bacterium]